MKSQLVTKITKKNVANCIDSKQSQDYNWIIKKSKEIQSKFWRSQLI